MQKLSLAILVVSILGLLFGLAGCQKQTQPANNQPPAQVYDNTPPQNQPSGNNPADTQDGKGNVVFTITDAAADMQAVSEVWVTVDSVRVHSAGQGWLTLSSEPKTYDLLELKAQASHELLVDTELAAGMYDQVHLDISKVVVVDEEGEQEAKLPSAALRINGDLEVKEDTTATASFDFIADESLHVTGNGKYILAPVVHLETRADAEVEVKADNEVEVSGGKVTTNVRVGMDENGKVDVNLKIPKDVNISISGDQIIVKGKAKIGVGSAKINASVDTETDIGIDI